MQFLKTLFWVVLAAGLVLFARENWVPVPINLWSGLVAEVKLPFLVGLVFLLGFLPTYLYYRGRMWTLRRQLNRPERVTVANQPAPLRNEPSLPLTDTPEAPIAEPRPVEPTRREEPNQPGLAL